MKTPRYTDHRYQNGYVPASRTNVAATFKRIRAQMKEASEQAAKDEAEAKAKTVQMRRAGK